MRLRTLPLSLSGIVTGISLADGASETLTILSLILTAALLQILSNLSNELGDTLNGTDTAEREGIHYSIQDGEMTIPQMKRLITTVVVLCCISGLAMIWASFHTLFSLTSLLLIALGGAAIRAAMHYTLGNNPYGYRGLGDLFVFIFFGLVSTLGGAFICSHKFDPLWMLPASAIGLFSVGVLNVNNIRDMKTDAATRITVAMKMGSKRARIYQTFLIVSAWVLLAIYSCQRGGWLYALTLPLFIVHLKGVWKRSDKDLDPMLPMFVLSTFALSILFLIA